MPKKTPEPSKSVDFNDQATKAARLSGRGDLLPENTEIKSPYAGGNAAVQTAKDATEVLREIEAEQKADGL